ncbi:hypothetical protein [Anaerobranca gottschalkii]|uniref:ABC-2 type transport system permease protein n=1 Tax=Anaerobranca gottschalkii DSM 13577 TaxID=1120990 RepID=A0A1H9ZH39_9FIRM|nr:hypothetical protein [Anaerobranca gottschalkii]SES80918.1 hypothetical protein SAMN03080614_100927 [Anaerobranca gottschalkii DSM 13577]
MIKTLISLYKVQWLMLYNRLFKNLKQKIKTLLYFIIITICFFAIIRWINVRLFDRLDWLTYTPESQLIVLFTVTFMVIFMFQFFSSLSHLVQNFYRSPELNYLMSTPLQPGIILIYKLINHILKTVSKEAIFFFPFILALSLSMNVRIGFYLILPIVYLAVATTSTSLGVLFGIYFIKNFSIKIFRYFFNIGNLLLSLWFFAFLFFNMTIPSWVVEILRSLSDNQKLLYLIPAYSGSELLVLVGIGSSNKIFVSLIFTLIIPIVIIAISYKVAQKTFYIGWLNSSVVESWDSNTKKYRKTKFNKNTLWKNSKNSKIINLIIYQWIRAAKNFDIMVGGVFFIVLYLILIYVSATFFSETPIFALKIIIFLGIFLVYTGVAVPFISSEIMLNPMLAKYQYSILKYLPISSKEILLSSIIMISIPTLVVLTVGLTVLALLLEVSVIITLLLIIFQCIVTIGYSILYQSVEVLYYQKYYSKNKFIGGIITFVLPLAYLLFSVGMFALYFSEIKVFMLISKYFSLPIIIILSVLTIVFQFFYVFKKIGVKSWEKIEF